MLAFLAIAVLIPAAGPKPPVAPDPVIQVKLSDDFYFRGERAKVRFKSERDGYLLIMRLDGDGRIRPLYPLDPADSAFVRGGREFEVRGRGDREAFTVDERDGVGYVLAAISDVPFELAAFSRGSHWDLRALAEATTGDDPEISLLDLVDSMAAGKYEYDLARYSVGGDRRDRVYRDRPWFGRPRYYNPWYHSYDPFYGPPFGVRFGVFVGGHRHYRRWW